VLALGLAVSAAFLSLQKYEAALLALDSDIAAAKARVQTLRQTISRSEAALSLAAALERLKHDSPRPAAVLEAMTRALPDDTYLSDLNISQGRVAIAGHSAKAVALVDGLEASDMFSSVEMTAPVLFDQSASKEQFRIEVGITSIDARHDAAVPGATAKPGPADNSATEAP
jgi:general secretion pathway protein L